MTDSVRHGEFSPATAGTPFHPGSPPRPGEWDGDHLRDLDDIDVEEPGLDPTELGDDDLIREMASLHRTRLDTLRHAPDTALATHLRRTAELETEYLARYPAREVDPSRLRDGE